MLILHNYAESPYAEKIRAMLGYTNLEWHSVDVPPQPPRPSLDPLLGGYRRIPVMQIGADIFCDTHTIATEIANRADDPSLDHANADAQAQALIDQVEGDLFMAAIMSAPKGGMLFKLLLSRGLGIFKFMKDRAAASREGGLVGFEADQAKPLWQAHLKALEGMLADQTFLAGDKPDIRDFAAYHTVWIYSTLAGGDIGGAASNVTRWRDAIALFGHGPVTKMTVQQSLQIAASNEPAAIDAAMQVAEKPVSIAPSDYMRAATSGTLVGENDRKWIIARNTEQHGRVHVHFPKSGYELT